MNEKEKELAKILFDPDLPLFDKIIQFDAALDRKDGQTPTERLDEIVGVSPIPRGYATYPPTRFRRTDEGI